MKANYDLEKQNSYYVTKYVEKNLIVRALTISNTRTKILKFSNIILF